MDKLSSELLALIYESAVEAQITALTQTYNLDRELATCLILIAGHVGELQIKSQDNPAIARAELLIAQAEQILSEAMGCKLCQGTGIVGDNRVCPVCSGIVHPDDSDGLPF